MEIWGWLLDIGESFLFKVNLIAKCKMFCTKMQLGQLYKSSFSNVCCLPGGLHAMLAICQKLNAFVHFCWRAQQFKNFGSVVQQAPPMQHFRISQFVVFEKGRYHQPWLRNYFLYVLFDPNVFQWVESGRSKQGKHPAICYNIRRWDSMIGWAACLKKNATCRERTKNTLVITLSQLIPYES